MADPPEITGHNRSYSDAVQRLSAAQKSGRGAPAYSKFVNRPLGRRFAAIVYVMGLTPNTVTFISACFTFSAIALLILLEQSVLLGLGVAALLVMGYGLDAADGQLARLTGGGSLSGEWLDHMVDCIKASTLHLSIAVNMFRSWDVSNGWLLVPLLMTALSSTSFFGQILGEQLKRSRGASTSTGSPSLLTSIVKMPTDYGVLCVTFALFGFTQFFLGAYTLITCGMLLYLLVVLPRWYNQIRELDFGSPS